MRIQRQARHVCQWARSLSTAQAVLAGSLGWWLLGVAICIGPFSGLDEPYGTWDSAKQGMVAGAVLSLVLSLWFSIPIGLLPPAIVLVLRFTDRRRHRLPRDFGPARGWLLSSWLVVPAAILLAPFSMVSEAASEIVDPVEVPGWTQDPLWYILGHWWATLSLFAVSCIVACLCALGSPVITSGSSTARCVRCRYDRAGLGLSVPCPECGHRVEDPPARTSPIARQWQLMRLEPARVAALLLIVASALAVGVFAWRAPYQHNRTPHLAQILGYLSVLVAVGAVCIASPRGTQRRRAQSLFTCLLLAVLAGIAWLCITRLAELGVSAYDPGSSPRSHSWWFFSTVNEVFLVLGLFVISVCYWLGRCAPRYTEDEVREETSPHR